MSGQYSKECIREAMNVVAKIDDRLVREPQILNTCVALQRVDSVLSKPIVEGEWQIISDTSDMEGYYVTPEESAYFMSRDQVALFMSQFKDDPRNRIGAANQKFHLKRFPLTGQVINFRNRNVPQYLFEIGAIELFPLLNSQTHESSQVSVYYYPWNMVALDEACPHPQTHRFHKGYKLPPIYIVRPNWEVIDNLIQPNLKRAANGRAAIIVNTGKQTVHFIDKKGKDITAKDSFQCYKGSALTQQYKFLTHLKANLRNDRNLISGVIVAALGHEKAVKTPKQQIALVNQSILDLHKKTKATTIKAFHQEFLEYNGKLQVHCDIEITS